jgi:acyl-CoA reductase-like NAD-dependent aldehyde dehydrogenase
MYFVFREGFFAWNQEGRSAILRGSMSGLLRTVSPIDGTIVAERPLAGLAELHGAVAAARNAQAIWRRSPVRERAAVVERFCQKMLSRRAEIAEELTRQMGRPLRYTPLEVDRLCERARYMAQIAEEALAPLTFPSGDALRRFICREPLGSVLTIAPWNYPYLTAVNSVVPAILAGNTVLLKHSAQTPLCAERFAQAFTAAGLPSGVFQVLHLSHEDTDRAIRNPGIDFVAFTGSVEGGSKVQRAAAERFIGVNLELGGKDPAYVRADANLLHAIENLVDGAFFNSGQSCCGIERIYVHERVYDRFVEGAVALVKSYVLGNPLDPATTLGPMVRASAADFVRDQIAEAIGKGARALVDPKLFPSSVAGTPYLAPQVLVEVDHSMRVMTEESFGPVVGIMRVRGDDEAVALMNDSAYGLTAAIWTEDADAAIALGERLETGTVFMNRCDFLDPALAWTGVKNSGRGCTLSRLGFEQLTRPKSYHLRVRT